MNRCLLQALLCIPTMLFFGNNVYAAYVDPVTHMEFVKVAGGCYQMGDSLGNGENDEKPVHEVCVDGFYIGKYEVTQGQWQTLMGNNPSKSQKGADYPVEQIRWNDIQDFITALNSKSGKQYRLPTEAEWEFACRSRGKKEKYCGSDDLDEIAWYINNYSGGSHPVGQKKPNGLGIYDMSGNIWELVQDWHGKEYYQNSPHDNPVGPASGTDHVLRGGGFSYSAGSARAAARGQIPPHMKNFVIGFRLVLPVQK